MRRDHLGGAGQEVGARGSFHIAWHESHGPTLAGGYGPLISNSLLGTAALALGAFAGTNIDNLVTLSSQLVASDKVRHRRIIRGQLTATALVIALCAVVGSVLETIPHRYLAALGLIPLTLGIRAGILRVRNRSDDRRVPMAAGYFSTVGVTLAISGDNVAVYLPILATGTALSGAVSIATWIVADIILVSIAGWVGGHATIRRRLEGIGPTLLPFVWITVGIVVLLRA